MLGELPKLLTCMIRGTGGEELRKEGSVPLTRHSLADGQERDVTDKSVVKRGMST
jgi:hypothetical protein